MANTYTTLNGLFTAIADAIRTKKNSTEVIVADNFPTEIQNLRTGFDYNNQNVTTISDYAFYGCEDLNSVDCCNLTSIGTSAFENCTNLKSVILYEGIESVGENTFDNCDNVIIYYKGGSIPETWHENFNPDNRPVLCGEIIETWNVSATEDDNLTAELYGDNNYTLFIYGNGDMKDCISGYATSPWNNYNQNISNVNIGNGVTSIGNGAFRYCESLTSINIPNSVTSIGDSAFNICRKLISITIPNSVTSIGDYVFSSCESLTSINIPNSVTNIGNNAFYNCRKLISITIPDSVTNIGNSAFSYCFRLTTITYTGTIAQWNSITFGSNWNIDTPDYTIHCTDGDIAKDGTITYHGTT